MKSVLREDHPYRVGADDAIDVVGADQLYKAAVLERDPHLSIVEVTDDLFGDVIEETYALVRHAGPDDLFRLVISG